MYQQRQEKYLKSDKMKKLVVLILFALMIFNISESQIIGKKILMNQFLFFESEKRAERISNKLWQVGYDNFVDEGTYGEQKGYFIELESIDILDIEIKRKILFWNIYIRKFPRRLKYKVVIMTRLII